MTNENLKNALQHAGLTPEEFAEIVRVDPKTVQRWVAGTTTPYRRHRAVISRALGVAEREFWPDDTPASDPDAGAVEPGPLARSEVTDTWGYATDHAAVDPVALIAAASGAIEVLDNGSGIEVSAALLDALLTQANAAREIRVLTSAPRLQLQPLTGHEHIEIRVTHISADHSLLRIGSLMLISLNLAAEADQPPPLLKLKRTADGGLFDRLASNLQLLWDNAERLRNATELANYKSGADHGNDEIDEDRPGRAQADQLRATDSTHTPDPVGTSAQSETGQARRQWPRRPN